MNLWQKLLANFKFYRLGRCITCGKRFPEGMDVHQKSWHPDELSYYCCTACKRRVCIWCSGQFITQVGASMSVTSDTVACPICGKDAKLALRLGGRILDLR